MNPTPIPHNAQPPQWDDDKMRVMFVHRLSNYDDAMCNNLLRLESQEELRALWDVAMRERFTAVAGVIEAHANSRGDF